VDAARCRKTFSQVDCRFRADRLVAATWGPDVVVERERDALTATYLDHRAGHSVLDLVHEPVHELQSNHVISCPKACLCCRGCPGKAVLLDVMPVS
jgi:hypothetical protein